MDGRLVEVVVVRRPGENEVTVQGAPNAVVVKVDYDRPELADPDEWRQWWREMKLWVQSLQNRPSRDFLKREMDRAAEHYGWPDRWNGPTPTEPQHP